MSDYKIIPGINNPWGLEPSVQIEGWITVVGSERTHYQLDLVAMRESIAEWNRMFPNTVPQTNGDWLYFRPIYKATKL